MNEKASRPKLSVEDTQKFYDMDHAFEYLANSAREANESGDYQGAMSMMFQLEKELPVVAAELGVSEDMLETALEKYRSIANLDIPEVGSEDNEGLTVGSLVDYEDKQWAIVAAKRNKRTGEMEYLISDATTKEEGLSNQRFVTEADLVAGSTLDSNRINEEQMSSEDNDSNEEHGRKVAQALLDRGLIGRSEFDSVAKSHAEIARDSAANSSLEAINDDPGEVDGSISGDIGSIIEKMNEIVDNLEGIDPEVRKNFQDAQKGLVDVLGSLDTAQELEGSESPDAAEDSRFTPEAIQRDIDERSRERAELQSEYDGMSDSEKASQAGQDLKGRIDYLKNVTNRLIAMRERVSSDSEEVVDEGEVESSQAESSPEHEKSQAELALEAARNEYAKATAHDRKSFWGRFLESDSNFFSRFIKEIPGAMQLAEFVNKNFTRHEFMDKARSEYEKALKADIDEKFAAIDESAEPSKQGEIDAILQNAEGKTEEEVRGLVEAVEKKYSPENILLQKMLIGTSEDALLEAQIIKERTEQSGKAGRLTSWWARQQGITGKLKKAGLVVAGGVLVGATVATGGLILGLGAVPAAASIAGGATGIGMGLRLNKGLAGASVDKDGTTVAQQESRRDRIRKAEDLKAAVDSNEYRSKVRGDDAEGHLADILAQSVIGGTEKSTAERVKGNRNRLKSIMALMAMGGRLGSGLVETINNSVGAVEAKPTENRYADPEDSRQSDGGAEVVEPTAKPAAEMPDGGDVVQPEPVETIKGTEFIVESGNGYTHELREFATVNGKQLSGQEAWNLHNDIMKQFGQDYIDIGGPGNDIYRQAGDVRLMEPGAATWKEGVPEYIMEWMKQRGL